MVMIVLIVVVVVIVVVVIVRWVFSWPGHQESLLRLFPIETAIGLSCKCWQMMEPGHDPPA